MKIQSYLTFDGNCQEALNFYGKLFNAEVENRQTYEDKKAEVPFSFRQKLQHAELKGKGVHFMAYDATPDTPINSGNQIHMSIDTMNVNEGEQLFEKLSADGNVHDNFREREWGYYGRCTDKFGIHWMINSRK